MESESVTQSEVESALHKTFLVVKAEPAFPQPVKKIDVEVKNQDQKNPEVIVIEKGTGERTDIDMVNIILFSVRKLFVSGIRRNSLIRS